MIFFCRVLQYLYDNTWIDVYTQAVFVEFTVYNANVNLFCIVTLMFETTATGTLPMFNHYYYRYYVDAIILFKVL